MESQGMIATCYAAWRGATEEGKVRPAVRGVGGDHHGILAIIYGYNMI